MEEREPGVTVKAKRLIAACGGSFLGMDFTLHPPNLPGEAPGKSSNESWAAKQVFNDYAICPQGQEVIITVMDGE